MQDQLIANESKRMKPIASLKHQNELNNFYPDAMLPVLSGNTSFQLTTKTLKKQENSKKKIIKQKKTRLKRKSEEYKPVSDEINCEEP